MDSESHITITASDVLKSLKETKLGKAAGIDGLAAEQFINSHVSITVHLSLLFLCMLSHGFLPDAFMRTSINIYDQLQSALNTNPQENYDTFIKLLSSAKNKHLPKRIVRFNKKKHKKAKWLTNGILKSINTKDK